MINGRSNDSLGLRGCDMQIGIFKKFSITLVLTLLCLPTSRELYIAHAQGGSSGGSCPTPPRCQIDTGIDCPPPTPVTCDHAVPFAKQQCPPQNSAPTVCGPGMERATQGPHGADINGDGYITALDNTLLQQYLRGASFSSAPSGANAVYDVNADGAIDASDSVVITNLLNANCPTLREGSCPLASCPSGQVLFDPEQPWCQCVADVCHHLKDVQRVTARTYHPSVAPDQDGNAMWSFRERASNVAIQDFAELESKSPCLAQAARQCVQGHFRFQGELGDGWGAEIALRSFRTTTYGILERDPSIEAAWQSPEIRARIDELNQTTPPPPGFSSWSREWFLTWILNNGVDFVDQCIRAHIDVMYGGGALRDIGWNSNWGYGATGSAHEFDALMYNDCRPVPPEIQQLWQSNSCSAQSDFIFNTYTSPVSLLWSKEIDITTIFSKTKFPINPQEEGKLFSWRGSGYTPLVVWDDLGNGVISKAAQLFGNHTWGKSWSNGYEALASLDKDKNGWLENTELEKIALWFDFNQDGVSDKGEVKTLASVGVTALGVTVTRKDDTAGLVFADKGFRRTIKTPSGQTSVEGASVDWFSSSVEGALGDANSKSNNDTQKNASSSAAGASKSFDLAKLPTYSLISQVSGMWDWYVVDLDGNELQENLPGGSLTLFAGTEGGIRGSLFNSQHFGPNSAGIGEVVSVGSFKGSVAKNTKGQIELLFESKNKQGATVTSSAFLSQDGTFLTGVTKEASSKDGKPYMYAWKAKRAL